MEVVGLIHSMLDVHTELEDCKVVGFVLVPVEVESQHVAVVVVAHIRVEQEQCQSLVLLLEGEVVVHLLRP